jgi:hypothetical protein
VSLAAITVLRLVLAGMAWRDWTGRDRVEGGDPDAGRRLVGMAQAGMVRLADLGTAGAAAGQMWLVTDRGRAAIPGGGHG